MTRVAEPGPGTGATPSPDGRPFPARFVAPLVWGSTLNPINSSIIATSLVAIATAFDVGTGQTAILVAAVYVTSAVAQPALGKLAVVFGPRRIFLAGLVVVTIAGIVGAFAPSFGWLIVSRVLIGLGTAAGNPTAMMLIRQRADRLGTGVPGPVLGAMSIAAQVTAALGLPLGGVLVGVWDWRAVFAVNIPMGLIGIAMALAWVPRDEPVAASARRPRELASAVDPFGMLAFAAAIVSVIVFLQTVADGPAWWLLGVAVVAAAGLVGWELRARHPFIDVRMLAANGPLVRTYTRQFLTQVAMYLVLYGYVQWLEQGRGLAASVSGLVMLPMTVVGAIGSALVARRAFVRGPLIGSASVVVLGGLAVLAVDDATPVVLLIALSLLFGAVTGLTGVANQTALYLQTDAARIGVAAGLLRTSTNLGAIGAAAVLGFAFPTEATDQGLHAIALVIVGLGAVVLALVLADRRLPWRAAA
ncbi:Major Facilitator Superfamily protein [Agromyces sp. CF514]|uniref:MFS transporter n=1 Tax=Agromyces sp. CF514 TaxID=1881031 RepID=UPI0008E25632|nr:MFS transporter [Agromyces sp. CF514]SFR91628.1 Major Facilitator Superfamily protein [Agromyces sp. CF514]